MIIYFDRFTNLAFSLRIKEKKQGLKLSICHKIFNRLRFLVSTS